ncbi:hypothetical protein Fcan01_00208 [Folsomia candida]|uniref:Uncharacterized protein n=1 Tax=Folsomia candida TaxID=158441 RepID=A0A226F4A9_FOLCA|nr:hypothetical protein Fcan01_00208 [Folsomia candida]
MAQFQCILATFYCFAMFLLLAFGGFPTTEKFQASVFFMLNLLACIVRWSNVIGNDAVQIINSFLAFEHSTVKAVSENFGTTRLAKAMKYFIWLIEISLPVISLLQMALFLFAPCTTPFIVSMSVECRGIRKELGLSRWIGHILDTWILSHGCYSAAIPVLFVLCVGIVCLLTYFEILKRVKIGKHSSALSYENSKSRVHSVFRVLGCRVSPSARTRSSSSTRHRALQSTRTRLELEMKDSLHH